MTTAIDGRSRSSANNPRAEPPAGAIEERLQHDGQDGQDGTALERDFTLGTPGLATVGRVVYLLVMLVVALTASSRRLHRKLQG